MKLRIEQEGDSFLVCADGADGIVDVLEECATKAEAEQIVRAEREYENAERYRQRFGYPDEIRDR